MASRAGLKRVVKTVRTKKGVKRQTFWVRVDPHGLGPGKKIQLHREVAKPLGKPKGPNRFGRFLGHAARFSALAAPLVGGLVGEYAGSKHGGAALHSLGGRMLTRGEAGGRGSGALKALGGFTQFHNEKIGGMAGGALGAQLGLGVAAGLAHLARRHGAG